VCWDTQSLAPSSSVWRVHGVFAYVCVQRFFERVRVTAGGCMQTGCIAGEGCTSGDAGRAQEEVP